ncbi:hypothetical protein [Microvirga sp. 2TAF3]|uniref:hypothetical protein n=1 Tax=Microvirga sp. 2TAF3 TaxID=3233014 RepID=UPI003F9D044C
MAMRLRAHGFFRIWVVLSVIWLIFAALTLVRYRQTNTFGVGGVHDPENFFSRLSCVESAEAAYWTKADRGAAERFYKSGEFEQLPEQLRTPTRNCLYGYTVRPTWQSLAADIALAFAFPIAALMLGWLGWKIVSWIGKGFRDEQA